MDAVIAVVAILIVLLCGCTKASENAKGTRVYIEYSDSLFKRAKELSIAVRQFRETHGRAPKTRSELVKFSGDNTKLFHDLPHQASSIVGISEQPRHLLTMEAYCLYKNTVHRIGACTWNATIARNRSLTR